MPRRAPRDRDGGFQTIVPAPFGALGVRVHDGMLWTIDCLPRCRSWLVPGDPLAARMMEALERYLQDPKTPWTLPVARRGTPFQQRVWAALRRIPPGRTLTYGELAARLGSGARAVGAACRANPVPVVVPCHRVVACDGIGGYDGQTEGARLTVKRWLLRHEGARLV
ncbi:MAG: methylated-DNA--[protein]-cysteine S-methyltransferase [Gammaproteobacteria bacterium]